MGNSKFAGEQSELCHEERIANAKKLFGEDDNQDAKDAMRGKS